MAHQHAWGLEDAKHKTEIEAGSSPRMERKFVERKFRCLYPSCDATKYEERLVSRDFYKGY